MFSKHTPSQDNTNQHKVRQPGTGAWFGGAEERLLLETKALHTAKKQGQNGLNKPIARIETRL